MKDTDEQPNEEVHREKSGRISSTESLVPVHLGCATLPASTQKLSKLCNLWILMEALSHRHD